MATAWSGAKGKHLEGGSQQVLPWPRQGKKPGPEQPRDTQSQEQPGRKRKSEERKDQTRIAKKEEAKNPKVQRLAKERDTQPKEATAPGKKRGLEAEGFKKLFPDPAQAPQEQSGEQGAPEKATGSRTQENRPKDRRIGQGDCSDWQRSPGKERTSRSAGREAVIPTLNRFEELDEGIQAQEVARKADADQEDRRKDRWEPAERIADIAKRKQKWKQGCNDREQIQRLEQAALAAPTGEVGGSLGTDPREAASSAHSFGSSTLVEQGPEAAGRPVPFDISPAKRGGDWGERVDPPGQLLSCGDRKDGRPEPSSALSTARIASDRMNSFSACSVQPARREGRFTPPMFLTFQGAQAPRRSSASMPPD
jgi:hypothetical protein